jgi:hypothetical protein
MKRGKAIRAEVKVRVNLEKLVLYLLFWVLVLRNL